MSKITASFGDPEFGWVGLSISAGDQHVEIDASDLYPSFFELVDALFMLHSANGERTVTWMCEPVEYDLRVTRAGEIVTLEVFVYLASSRSGSLKDAVLTASGNYEEICLPFWRAMRHLQARYPPEELEERWENAFPHRELDSLTVFLGKSRSTD